MGLVSFFHRNGPINDYGQRGFVLPNGIYRKAPPDKDHPGFAEIIVNENEMYLKAFKKMQEKTTSCSYYNFLLTLGCIETDSPGGAYGAKMVTNPVIKNSAQKDVEDYNRFVGSEVYYEKAEAGFRQILNSIWEDLTKGEANKNGSR